MDPHEQQNNEKKNELYFRQKEVYIYIYIYTDDKSRNMFNFLLINENIDRREAKKRKEAERSQAISDAFNE